MNIFERVIWFIQKIEMETPLPYGWFHLMWIGLTVLTTVLLCLYPKSREKQTRDRVIAVYAIVSWILEILKQLVFSLNVSETGVASWSYQWYAAPFQFCTTPFITAFVLMFLKEGKVKNALLCYLGFYTIVAGFATVAMPTTLFVRTIEVDIHTMFIHCGSIVIGLYLLICGHAKPTLRNLFRAFIVFLIYVALAEALNILVYRSGVMGSDEVFNMFYISPYYNSSLPVFCDLQPKLPYAVFLTVYIAALSAAAALICGVTRAVGHLCGKKAKQA